MSILDRYLGLYILKYTLLILLGLLGLLSFISFIDQLPSLGKGNYGLSNAMAYVALTLPTMAYEIFPMSALLGTMLGLSLLANDSELLVMRASGVSLMRITAAVLKTGTMLVLIAFLIGEYVAPHTETRAQQDRAEALQTDIKTHTSFGLWIRDSGMFINIREVLPDLSLLNIKVFNFDENSRLRALLEAKRGIFADGRWVLEDIRETLVDADHKTRVLDSKTRSWESRVTPQILSIFLAKPSQLTFLQLRRYIDHLNANRQETSVHELAFWNKITLPLSTAVMVVLAIPFVFIHLRSGMLGRNLFVGIMLGIGFYAGNKGLGFIVLANGMPPLLGACLPVVCFALVAVLMLRKAS